MAVIVILGAVSANLLFWQIGNRYPSGAAHKYLSIEYMFVCLLFMFTVRFMSFIEIDVRLSKKQFAMEKMREKRKKEKKTYNEMNCSFGQQ